MQTAKGSLIESLTNLVVGYAVNFTANMLILPLFGFESLTLGKNLVLGSLYTIISLIRSYVLRRAFNKMKRFEVVA